MVKMLSKNLCYVAERAWNSPMLSIRTLVHPPRTRSCFHTRSRLEPKTPIEIVDKPLHIDSLLKPFIFTLGFSAASLGGCAIWQYERLREHAKQYMRKPPAWFNGIHTNIKKKNVLTQWWSELRDSDKVFYPILVANVLVFGSWRVRSLQPFMTKYFCSNPAARSVCIPMVLSTFSHYAPLHLAANMFVLHSFMPGAVGSMGKEQFVGMYLTAGVVSSFASLVYKTLTQQPGLSLGASGAIMAVLGYVCVQYPETKLSIIFLPFYTFAAGNAIKVIMGLDFAGVLMGWKFFDHAAHLGGALFGIGWCTWGGHHIWGNRDKFLSYWHAIREAASPSR